LKIKIDINRNTIISQVLEVLEKSIISGKIPPGRKLSEAGLAKSLGVSRVPVREALIRLEELQLVRKKLHGREVARISPQDLRELFEIKALLESYAAAKGSKTRTSRIIKRLRQLVDRMDECLDPMDYLKLRKINHQFHNLLADSGGNRKLYEIYLNVAKHIRWTTHISLIRPGRPELSNKEHRQIYDAFEAGDDQRVQDLIRVHTYESCDRVTRSLEGEEGMAERGNGRKLHPLFIQEPVK